MTKEIKLPMKFVPGGRRYEPELPLRNKPMKPVKFNLGNFWKNWYFIIFMIIILLLAILGVVYVAVD